MSTEETLEAFPFLDAAEGNERRGGVAVATAEVMEQGRRGVE